MNRYSINVTLYYNNNKYPLKCLKMYVKYENLFKLKFLKLLNPTDVFNKYKQLKI